MTGTSVPTPFEGDPSALVAAKGIDVSFGRARVLAGVDLAVHRGEIVTLIGPNGSGKTTLVRVVLGLLNPQGGAVRRRPDLSIGYVPQRLSVDPALPMTVRRFLSLPRRQPEAALHQVLEEVGAGYLIEQPIHSLSGGETQRLLLARALLRDPDLLVLDEPLQGVDFNGQLALFELIGAVRHRRNCGVLMVSHDLHLVMAGTDRVVCLNHHICCTGAPEAVSRHPEYLALFGPRAAEGLAVYTHAHDHHHDISGAVVEDGKPSEAGR